jgi:hypothetical protein
MRMFLERSWVVELRVEGVAGQALLYARFGESGSLAELALYPDEAIGDNLRTRGVLIGDVECGSTFLDGLLRWILAPIGPANCLVFNHRIMAMNSVGQRLAMGAREILGTEKEAQGPEVWRELDVVREIVVQTGSGEISSGRHVFTEDAMGSLSRDSGLLPIACGTCHYSGVTGYGGDDDRHGLFCLRDVPELLDVNRGARMEWMTRAWTGVDAFHVCPCYRAKATWAGGAAVLDPR